MTDKSKIDTNFNIKVIKETKKFRKKDYMTSKRSFLKKGNILPIYDNWKDEEGLLGYARLNHRINDGYDDIPYERAIVGSGEINEPDMVIYSFQRWNITFVDPLVYNKDFTEAERFKYRHQAGFTTNRNISYFLTVNSNHKS